ncbi:aspartate racemase [Shewanella psychrophila]|uniref:Aspartate racemase n=1 Tax=Shewanella psychrophila TaxID=225848 RepID=A0A1S6HMH0_9GAMM|nr:aspartate/glutamate racemase family protein [Shewanella psychrophila]AQS36702.1 aspartate racemase [Shewanella psychrophila]
MKTIGMIGGMSWESTVSYYQAINQGVKHELGGLHSAKIALYSVDFAEIERLQHLGEWGKTAEILAEAARSVEAAGADFFMICTNTMHKVAEKMEHAVEIPLLHIADATAHKLIADGVKTVGLLGTQFTMEQDFYKGRLIEKYGIEVLTPDLEDREVVHRVIYEELCLGKVEPQSRQSYLKIIESLYVQGAQAVILGCTEIALLVNQQDTQVPLYDTTAIHSEAAVTFSLGK